MRQEPMQAAIDAARRLYSMHSSAYHGGRQILTANCRAIHKL